MIGRPLQMSLAWPLLVVFAGCGEPMYDNAGSPHSLLEDREACAMEIDQSPAALAYRQNPSAHPDYPNQIFEDLNRCIERKGWKQVRSQQDQEQLRDTIAAEAARTGPPPALSDSTATKSFVQTVEDRLVRASGSAQGEVKKN